MQNRKGQSELNDTLAAELAALEYPGFSHLKASPRRAPAEVVLSALQAANLEPRLVEALPWVLSACRDLDWSGNREITQGTRSSLGAIALSDCRNTLS